MCAFKNLKALELGDPGFVKLYIYIYISSGIDKDYMIDKELDKIHNPRRILNFVLHKFQK